MARFVQSHHHSHVNRRTTEHPGQIIVLAAYGISPSGHAEHCMDRLEGNAVPHHFGGEEKAVVRNQFVMILVELIEDKASRHADRPEQQLTGLVVPVEGRTRL